MAEPNPAEERWTLMPGGHFRGPEFEGESMEVVPASEVERLGDTVDVLESGHKHWLERAEAAEAEVERLREALEASAALFAWLQDNYPNGLVAAPTNIMQRLERARAALADEKEG